MTGSRMHVLVAGGGVAGLEALLALRHLAGDHVDLSLLSPRADFAYRPMAVAEPFGRGHAAHHALANITAELDVRLVRGALAAVDHAERVAITAAGNRLNYDALLVAVGAHSERALRGALTWTPESDPELFGGLLRDIEEGYTKRVAFVVPPGVAWALPAYELALMTAWQAWGAGQDDVCVTVYTHEDAPLGLFGRRASAALREDLERVGIAVETGVHVTEEADAPQRLVLRPDDRLFDTQRVVALPRAAAQTLAGLPTDRRGFVLCDLHGRVHGCDGVWAAGDAIAFPIKQGGLAAQQADAAAEMIAAAAGADVDPAPFRPVLRGMMLTGRGPEWMRHSIGGGAGDGTASRRALWWPPSKIAGRYLSPYLAALDGAEPVDRTPPPQGEPVELDLERDLPSVTDALRKARVRGEIARARFARHQVAARNEEHTSAKTR